MKCPRCSAQDLSHLDLGEREFIAVESCPHCRGCWLDHQQLERLEAGAWSRVEDLRLNSVEALSDVICPKCTTRTARVSPQDHPELNVDRCPSCHGLWLDHGEFEPLHELASEYAASHGGLHERPEGWSHLRWVSYRLAERWKITHEE